MSPGPASRGMTWKSVAVHSFDINDMNDMENMLRNISCHNECMAVEPRNILRLDDLTLSSSLIGISAGSPRNEKILEGRQRAC